MNIRGGIGGARSPGGACLGFKPHLHTDTKLTYSTKKMIKTMVLINGDLEVSR